MKSLGGLALAFAALPVLAADLPTCAGPAFGTTYRVTLAREIPGRSLAAVHREIEAVIARIDRAASTWRDDSDASRFNRAAPGEWVDVGEDLVTMVEVGRLVHKSSQGAFDLTVTADGAAAPGMDAIESRREPPALRKTRAGVTLDLGGIGPGHAVDAIGHRLAQLGSQDHLVELGGEVRGWGRRPDGAAWRVWVDGVGDVTLDPMPLPNGGDRARFRGTMALATSSARPGRSPVDPRTGRLAECRSPTATARAMSCAEADAWAVAALVLGLEPGPDGVIDRPAAAPRR